MLKDRVALLLLGLIVVLLAGMCFLAHGKGAVMVATPGAKLHFRSRLGRDLVVQSGSPPMAVPVRAYQPVSLALAAEQDGAVWKASSFGPWGKLGRIQVARGRTTALELGPPFLIKPQVTVYPGLVRVALGLFGRAGEQYSNSILRNSQPIPGPHVKIIDEAGTVLASGQFQYG